MFVFDDFVRVRKYLNVVPYISRPISSSLIGCNRINILKFIYQILPKEKIFELRRGMRINLECFLGSSEINQAVLTAMLHASNEAKYF